MGRSNIDVVRECFARFSERDVDGFVELVHPEVVWKPANGLLEEREPYHGHEGIREWFRDVTVTSRYLVKLATPALDEGPWLLWPAVVTVESDESRVDSGTLVWYLFRITGGKVAGLRSYRDERAARAAVEAARDA